MYIPTLQLLKTDYVLYKIKLKNADQFLIIDDFIFDWLENDPYFTKIDFLHNIRLHSSGCSVFQKTWKTKSGAYTTETIYPHKLIAEKFISKQKSLNKNLVGTKNGNKLDCRIHNLEYRSRSIASRKRKSSSRLGYTGVYQEHKRYRAVISIGKKSMHLGMFGTPEEAALAYNQKSKELFGDNGKINIIRGMSL